MNLKVYLLVLIILVITACHPVKTVVYPKLETTPVQNKDDAADDAVIFIHPTNPANNAIIGTNKQFGLVVYNASGEAIHEYPIGRVNNVDLRPKFLLNDGESIVLVGGSNRTDNTISLLKLDPESLELRMINARPLISAVNEVYGFCFYQNEKTYAFVVGKDGIVEQWELFGTADGKVDGKVVRSFDVGEQCEGLVADEEKGHLYIGEEVVGIWKYQANPDAGNERKMVDSIKDNKMLKADVEGLTIYYTENGKGYLIASSQGNNSYAVYEREGNNKYLGSFKIVGNEQVDGTSETDGIDVINLPFNPELPNGFFIVQDGANRDGKAKGNQNFKLIPWESIARAFSPPLIIDQGYRIIKH